MLLPIFQLRIWSSSSSSNAIDNVTAKLSPKKNSLINPKISLLLFFPSFVLSSQLFLSTVCYLLFDQDFFLTFGIINCFQPLTQVWCTCVKKACTPEKVSTVNSKKHFFHNQPLFFLPFVCVEAISCCCYVANKK